MSDLITPRKEVVAGHFAPEPFKNYAWAELEQFRPWIDGVCFNPACSEVFDKNRDWQVYCCTACETAGTNEARKWGHKMAMPLLIHRMGKYAADGTAQKALTTAARRYVTRVQSEWLADRGRRIEGVNKS